MDPLSPVLTCDETPPLRGDVLSGETVPVPSFFKGTGDGDDER
jgi:hypothetical protein